MYMLGFLRPSPETFLSTTHWRIGTYTHSLTPASLYSHPFEMEDVRVRKHLHEPDFTQSGDGKLVKGSPLDIRRSKCIQGQISPRPFHCA